MEWEHFVSIEKFKRCVDKNISSWKSQTWKSLTVRACVCVKKSTWEWRFTKSFFTWKSSQIFHASPSSLTSASHWNFWLVLSSNWIWFRLWCHKFIYETDFCDSVWQVEKKDKNLMMEFWEMMRGRIFSLSTVRVSVERDGILRAHYALESYDGLSVETKKFLLFLESLCGIGWKLIRKEMRWVLVELSSSSSLNFHKWIS